jgi:hypothetical protein
MRQPVGTLKGARRHALSSLATRNELDFAWRALLSQLGRATMHPITEAGSGRLRTTPGGKQAWLGLDLWREVARPD